MIIDNFLKLSDDQEIRATVLAENVIDLSVQRDIGEGKQLYAIFTVGTAFTHLTSLKIEIITAENELLVLNPLTLVQSQEIPAAELLVGKQVLLLLPPIIASRGKQYLGARYTVDGANPQAGSVSLNFVINYQDGQKYYPAN
jgi:hypothetical protein